MEFDNKSTPLRWLDTFLGRGSILAVVLVSLILLAHTVRLVTRLWNPVPCGDIISQYFWMSESPTQFSDLFRPNNEHIIAFPRLFYFIDIFYFDATGKFLVTMNVILAVATIAFFGFVFRKHFGLGRTELALYLCTVAILYLNGIHFFNLLYGFMIQHWLENFLLVLFAYAFARLATASEPAERIKLATCLLPLAFAATFTSGDGILCLVAAIFLGVLFRLGWKYLGYLTFLLVGLTVLYLKINPAIQHDKPFALFANLWNSLKFYCAFFGSPFLRFHVWPGDQQFWSFEPTVAVLTGALVLMIGAILCIRSWLDSGRRDVGAIFLVFLFVFLLGTGVLCTNSRIDLGVYEGTNKKYANTVVLTWIAVFSLGIKQAAEKFALSRGQRQIGLIASFVVFFAMILPAHLREKKVWEQWCYHVWESETSLVSGVNGGPILYYCDWRPQEFFNLSQNYLRPRKWTVFGRYPFEIGDPLAARFTVDTNYPCVGHFDSFAPQAAPAKPAEGFQVIGWAWDKERNRPVQDIILVNGSGQIAGIAHSTRDRPDVRSLIPHDSNARCGWFGYAKAGPGEGPLAAYAIIGRNVVPLGTQNSSGPAQLLTASR